VRVSAIVNTHTSTVTLADHHDAVCVYIAIVGEILGESYVPSRLPGTRIPGGSRWTVIHDDRGDAKRFAAGARTLHDERTTVVLDDRSVTVTSDLGPTAEGQGLAGLLTLPRMLSRGRDLLALSVEVAALNAEI
jgi:hypothetical protein